MRTRLKFIACLTAAIAVWSVVFGGVTPPGPEYTTDFMLQHCPALIPTGGNLFWTLEPGTTFLYEGDDEGVFVELEIKVLDQTKLIPFMANGQPLVATARVIREREFHDGVLVEVSRNYYARCPKTSNIFYFGERVNFFENGEIVGHEGSWLAGENGAEPGMIMPALFTLGARYFQEVAPGVAMDRAKHVEMGLQVTTPAGTFDDCVRVVETTPLEPGSQSVKIYAPGVGLLMDGPVELIEVIQP